ncbi:MAG TPA: alanine--tRNA ligase [Acidimicrobiales bacterium]|nr:alanine--tRNA ligase [Acidimicrobiales bacterium]
MTPGTVLTADQLRAAFTGFFSERAHVVVPSASLIPQDPSVLFTIAGMVPFKPFFVGDEIAPWSRATSIQKCFRTVDIDVVGSTRRHCTFFEMLGNFSFGDYFKDLAIPYAWELVTDGLGMDADRLWITVHDDDDEAEQIWRDGVGVPAERIQRLGDDNFWKMGDTGPCGPSSEIFFDMGGAYGEPGGPAHGGSERFVEIWNLVFMQYNRRDEHTLEPLPRPSIDTGAGLERILPILQGVDSIFATDLFLPMIEAAQSITGNIYGRDERTDVGLRILADHGRAMSMLVADGVLPANEGRGYVLRRIIRRAVRRGRQLGVDETFTPRLVNAAIGTLSEAYAVLAETQRLITDVVAREEEGFLRTLATGSAILEEQLAAGEVTLRGDVAFKLHDTYGFPVELTMEIAEEAGVAVDLAGFEAAMDAQRAQARAAARSGKTAAGQSAYRSILDNDGRTQFIGQYPDSYSAPSRVIAVLSDPDPDRPGQAEIFLDRTPFYAESGGQVGDTGSIITETGTALVYDTVYALPGLIAHRARIDGEVFAGQDALATIDAPRRDALRRNHTGTHLLHAALRNVLGDHVHQQGSLVAPDRLRFDFSHPGGVAPEELSAVTAMANADVLTDADVEVMETTRAEAESMGALAFFGDKYGDRVRVVRAGAHSIELCGGTHVGALGMIGPITVVSESSIGSNTRRIEAVTGAGAFDRIVAREGLLTEAATLLRTEPENVPETIARLLERQRTAEKALERLKSQQLQSDAASLVGEATDGVVVARRDGLTPDELRDLAQSARKAGGLRAVVLGGSPDGVKAAVAVAVDRRAEGTKAGMEAHAGNLVKRIGPFLGGGGGGSPEVAVAGGRDPAGIDNALDEARKALAGG